MTCLHVFVVFCSDNHNAIATSRQAIREGEHYAMCHLYAYRPNSTFSHKLLGRENVIYWGKPEEAHTSMTALAKVMCVYVCMFAAIYRKF